MKRTSAYLGFFLLTLVYSTCQSSKPTSLSTTTVRPIAVDTTRALTTIAFGSCNRQDEPQPLWDDIRAQNPDLWIWLGDNVYGDTDNMRKLEQKYQDQRTQPEYQQLLAEVPVVGTWDDHDYGVNDGGKEFGPKKASRNLLLDFLNVPKGQPVWDREGAYQSYAFGPVGQRVKIILLDTRYFRDELLAATSSGKGYGPNPTGDLLGDAQWRWLEDQLTNSDAQVHIIGSSIQVLAEDHRFEKWANFPQSRQRLLDLLTDTKPSGVVLLSGDRHIGEISRYEVPSLPYPLYDITSSGLTHVYEEADEENRYRVSELVTVLNFGLIEINWRREPIQMSFRIIGENGRVLVEEEVTL